VPAASADGVRHAQAIRFLDAAPGLKYKAALSVAYGAGLRASEVVSLKISDKELLLDHLVGERQHALGDGEAHGARSGTVVAAI